MDTSPSPLRSSPSHRRRAALAAVLTLLLAICQNVVAAAPAAAATIDTSAWYVLVSRHSGKAIDVYNFATHDGAPIVQWSRNDGNQQQWRFVDSGGGYYRLKSRHSGKVLDISGRSTADGAEVIQWTDHNGANQQFRVADSDSGYVRLINRNSGKALDVWEWSTADGGRISQYTDTGGWNQQWRLIKVGGSGGNNGGGSASCNGGSHSAEAVLNGGTWTARNSGGTVLYSGSSMLSAMQAAVNGLPAGRTTKHRVIVVGSGSISAGSRLSLPSYTILDVCGTINVTGSGSGDMAPVYARGVTDVEVQNLKVTGSPVYGIFIRNGVNITLRNIDLRLSSGLGVRIDNHGDRNQRTRNVRIDNVYVSGASSHAVETYGVDGLTVGTVTARNVGESGLLLNDTDNATVTRVDAENAGTGTGYAAFRMANRNGRNGGSYATNIRVGEVIARGGGRGVFCVSESGGAVIDRVTITDTGNNPILIENCYNVTIAAQSGTVTGGEVRLAARSEFPGNRDITLQNLTLNNARIRESPCGTNITIRNIVLNNSTITRC